MCRTPACSRRSLPCGAQRAATATPSSPLPRAAAPPPPPCCPDRPAQQLDCQYVAASHYRRVDLEDDDEEGRPQTVSISVGDCVEVSSGDSSDGESVFVAIVTELFEDVAVGRGLDPGGGGVYGRTGVQTSAMRGSGSLIPTYALPNLDTCFSFCT